MPRQSIKLKFLNNLFDREAVKSLHSLFAKQDKIAQVSAKEGFAPIAPSLADFRDHSEYVGNIGQSLSLDMRKTPLLILNTFPQLKINCTIPNSSQRKDFIFQLPWALAYKDGHPDFDRSEIMVQVYSDDITSMSTILGQYRAVNEVNEFYYMLFDF